jgi:hypothetical protein
LSPSASFASPTVVPSEAFGPLGLGFTGAHSAERCGSGAAVSAIGVAGVGGASAWAAPRAANIAERVRIDFVRMGRERRWPRGRSRPEITFWARRFFENWRSGLKWQRLKPYEKFATMIERH